MFAQSAPPQKMSGLNLLMSPTNQGLLAQGVFQQSIILLVNLSPVPSLRPGRVHIELRPVHHRAQLSQKPEHPCGLYVSLKFNLHLVCSLHAIIKRCIESGT